MNYLSHILSYKYSIFNPDPDITIDNFDWNKHQYSCIIGNWCFVKLYRSLAADDHNRSVLVTIFLHKGWTYLSKNQNHIYLFDNDDSTLWLEEVRKMVDFEYKLIETDSENYELRLLFNLNRIKIKFATTMIRALFEYPQVYFLKEVVAMKKAGLYEEISLFNLYNMMFMFNFNSTDGHNLIQAGSCICNLSSYEDIRKKLETVTNVDGILRRTSRSVLDVLEARNSEWDNAYFRVRSSVTYEWRDISSMESINNYYKQERSIERYENLYKRFFDRLIEEITK